MEQQEIEKQGIKAIVKIKTTEGKSYIGKLCRHFKHKIEATYTDNTGHAIFPAGVCNMLADAEFLTFEVEANGAEGMEKIQGALDRHLIKFAFREELVINWETLPS